MTGKRLFIMTMLLLMSASLLGADKSPDEFVAANKFYEEKDYASAIRLFESIINQGNESAEVYFNLGNAYFKSGDLGYAVLYYTKARRLSPADEDIRHNLEFARRFSRVQMEGVQLNPINTFFDSLVDSYRLDFLAWVSSAFFVLFFLILVVRYGIGMNNPLIRIGIVVSLIFLLITSALTTFKYRQDFLARRAVIVAEDSQVHTGPSDQSEIELEGAPGLIVQIVDESGEYYNVLFENKRRGWIQKDLVAEI